MSEAWRRDGLAVATSLTELGRKAWKSDDQGGAARIYAEALALYRAFGDEAAVGKALIRLGSAAYVSADHSGAEAAFEEALAIWRQRDDRPRVATCLVGLANALFLRSEHDLAEAARLCEEALPLVEDAPSRPTRAWALYVLAEIERDLGRFAAARAHAEESLALDDAVGSPGGFAQLSLADLDFLDGALDRAAARAHRALIAAREGGWALQTLRCLDTLAIIAAGRGDASRAIQLLATTTQARPFAARPSRVKLLDDALEQARMAVSQAEYLRVWLSGATLSVAEASDIELASHGGAARLPASVRSSNPVDEPNEGARHAAAAGIVAPGGTVPHVEVRLLGGFRVIAGGDQTTLSGQPAELVKRVAMGGAVHIEELLDTMWPEADEDTARPRLRNVLRRVRQVARDLVVRDGDLIRLGPGVRVDVADFEIAANVATASARRGGRGAARLAAEALAMYPGELLPGDRFSDWLISPRERVRRTSLQLVDLLIDEALAEGDSAQALVLLERAIGVEPYDVDRYVRAATIAADRGWKTQAWRFTRRGVAISAELGLRPPGALTALIDDLPGG
ncbi:MAG: hypothetical protein NVS3B12_26970 [Acidimicrobiales bacterium]